MLINAKRIFGINMEICKMSRDEFHKLLKVSLVYLSHLFVLQVKQTKFCSNLYLYMYIPFSMQLRL